MARNYKRDRKGRFAKVNASRKRVVAASKAAKKIRKANKTKTYGTSRKTANKKQLAARKQRRQANAALAVGVAISAAPLISTLGQSTHQTMSNRRAQSDLKQWGRNAGFKPSQKIAKPNRKGVYNITTL